MGNGVIAASRRKSVSVTGFSTNKVGEASSAGACAFTVDWTYYHDGAGTYPVNGDVIYENDPGTTKLVGNNKWFILKSPLTRLVGQISNTGVVSNSTACI